MIRESQEFDHSGNGGFIHRIFDHLVFRAFDKNVATCSRFRLEDEF